MYKGYREKESTFLFPSAYPYSLRCLSYLTKEQYVSK